MKPTSKKDKYIVECSKKEHSQEIINFIRSPFKGKYHHWNYIVYNGTPSHDGFDIIDNYDNKYDYPVIPFEEWRALPDEEPKESHKKIIGYKLVKREYDLASAVIAFPDSSRRPNFDAHKLIDLTKIIFTGESFVVKNLKKAGVLDLWFEPVYKETLEDKIFDYLAESGMGLDKEQITHIINLVKAES